jgi:hypothetical protein
VLGSKQEPSLGLPELVIGLLVVLLILGITAIAQPPNRWVEWFSKGKKQD